jgi:hypothetical protein
MHTGPEQAGTGGNAGFTLAFAVVAAGVTVLARLAPYWFDLDRSGPFLWQLMPVGALALFAGARLRWPWALAVPLLAMLTADLLLIRPLAARGFSAFSATTPVLYACFAVYVLLGRVARQGGWPWSLWPICLAGSVQFFVVTNILVWAGGHDTSYPLTLAGLGECYVAAVPFFKNTLAGDLLYTGLFFGLHALAVHVRSAEKASQSV